MWGGGERDSNGARSVSLYKRPIWSDGRWSETLLSSIHNCSVQAGVESSVWHRPTEREFFYCYFCFRPSRGRRYLVAGANTALNTILLLDIRMQLQLWQDLSKTRRSPEGYHPSTFRFLSAGEDVHAPAKTAFGGGILASFANVDELSNWCAKHFTVSVVHAWHRCACV